VSTVAVIGGGIAGLVAACEAARQGARVTLLEAAARLGGVIVTEHRDGCLVEGGPDGFLGGTPEIPDLCAELGIADQIIGQEQRDVLLWQGRRLERLASGKAAEVLELATGEAEASGGFVTLRGGLGELVDALAARLAGRARLRTIVARVSRSGSGFVLQLDDGETVEADAVVLATPSRASSRLIRELDPELAAQLAAENSLSTATVVLAFARADVAHPLDASGFVVPRREASAVVACSFASSKFAGRAPAGVALLRAHVGRFGRVELLEADDATLVAAVEQDLSGVLGLRAGARWSRVFRWPLALPRRDAMREERLMQVRGLAARAGLLVAGAAFGGAGLPACVRSGREAGAAATRGALVA
jgi:protoporphyrinogen/coproporphyrinogen III oxidase